MSNDFEVLVVDDDLENQAIISALLNFSKIKFDLANNGQQALELIDGHSYNIVLMDIMMPVMGGLEATACIRAMGEPKSSTPIFAVSYRRDLAAKAQWKAQGLNGFLAKPFTLESLLSLLDRYR
ncbi:MAG: CheY-like chemotaxis protein [Oceanospirillaceae bacterium]|jgi:CheY-like chemotaxis protein